MARPLAPIIRPSFSLVAAAAAATAAVDDATDFTCSAAQIVWPPR